jgi:diguanylate cyclase (GGDEF)-like protein
MPGSNPFISDTELPASPGQRRIAAALAAFITLVALATLPFAHMPGPVVTAFVPAGATAVILLDLITALLFLLQFRQHGRPSTLMLGCAYLYTGLVVIPYILVFPGVFTSDGLLGAGSQSAAWLWLFWHGGFPALLLAHAAALRRERRSDAVAIWPANRITPAVLATLLLVAALGVVATLGHDWLPVVIRQDNYQPPGTPGIGLVVCLLNLAALAAIWLITRGRTVTQLWLLIAMLAFLFDTAISLAAGTRYSVGWYLARINSLLCAGAVLGAFIFEFHRLQAHLSVVNQRLSELADTDVLTSLGNRRSFDRQLTLEWARAARNREPLGLLLLDIDHFKAYNDCYGHQAGDACLQRVAGAIRDTLHRPGDFAARYGGEEVAIILPQTGNDSALHVANALCKAVRQLAIEHHVTDTGIVTCSIGVAVMEAGSHQDATALFAQTDAALYRAKNAGRNQVHC